MVVVDKALKWHRIFFFWTKYFNYWQILLSFITLVANLLSCDNINGRFETKKYKGGKIALTDK